MDRDRCAIAIHGNILDAPGAAYFLGAMKLVTIYHDRQGIMTAILWGSTELLCNVYFYPFRDSDSSKRCTSSGVFKLQSTWQ